MYCTIPYSWVMEVKGHLLFYRIRMTGQFERCDAFAIDWGRGCFGDGRADAWGLGSAVFSVIFFSFLSFPLIIIV